MTNINAGNNDIELKKDSERTCGVYMSVKDSSFITSQGDRWF